MMRDVFSFSSMVGPFMDEFYELQDKMEERKEEIKKEWIASRNLPRKQKKRKRKELSIDWQIANWSLGIDNF